MPEQTADLLGLKNALLGSNASAAESAPSELPETIEINGVTYRRDNGFVDKKVNSIEQYKEIAARTGLDFWEVVSFIWPERPIFSGR